MSPFHALYTARELSSYAKTSDRLVPAYASSDIEIYPYQIAAAMFALRSPYLKGVVLADEGSLGKTYEALLVITQLWYEGKERILLVVPTPLLHQWWSVLQNNFSVDFQIHAEGDCSFDFKGIILTTYDFSVENAEKISNIVWDVTVFEEAHRLAKPYNKTTAALKESVGNAYKILLTATPMQNSIMDLYGLIDFIDTGALGDADEFYKRYFRKPENYSELTATASRYCFRALRSQVEGYVKIPHRVPVTADFPLSAKEMKLAAMLDEYLKKPDKLAFPKMETYDLTLMLTRTLSSSTFAFDKLLQGAIERVVEPELIEMQKLAAAITINAKGQELIKSLKRAFIELKKKGANRKAIIFTENKTTQKYLFNLLKTAGYTAITYSGDKTRDYDIIKQFETEADILIATNIAAEGFHFAFCSLVINYDLPYNVLTLEQRIMRCHRQGQQNNVVVLNFLNKQNFADVRMLELINKRVLQFDGIMGMSDDVVGNFTENAVEGIAAAFEQTRHRKDIEAEFQARLAAHEDSNITAVEQAENALFTSFTRDIADKVAITPQYIKDRTTEINAKLWELTRWFFAGKQGYECIDETRTLRIGIQPQKVFTGAHLGRREYSIDDKDIAKSGRHTVSGTLAKNMIGEIFWRGISDSGTVEIRSAECEIRNYFPCRIGYYQIKVKSGYFSSASYYIFIGKTRSGETISDSECREIMKLPTVAFTAGHDIYGDRDGITKTKPPHEFDGMIDPTDYITRAASDTDDARREEIESINYRTYHRKQALNRDIEVLKGELRQIENALSRTASVAERVDAEKRKSTASRDLKAREQSLFMDVMRLDVEAEEAVKKLTEQANLTAEIKRQFVIEVTGGG